jgi:hypothetical protein
MNRLTQAQFQGIVAKLFQEGRPLDQARFRYFFSDGDAKAVLEALQRFQNEDGGFGHGLEPDLRTPASSVIATTQGCAILRELGVDAGEPIVQRASHYLIDNYDADRRVWPIVPPTVEDAPHAPWWTYSETERNFGGFRANPSAAVVGYLHDYPELAPAALLNEATAAVLEHLAHLPDKIEMHDLLCYVGLAGARHLPAAARGAVITRLRQAIPYSVERDPEAWAAYSLQPLDVAPAPAAELASALDPSLIEANLDSWIEQLPPDELWPIPWNWAFVDAAAWAQAQRDWQGHLAVQRLRVLQAYGRIEQGESFR